MANEGGALEIFTDGPQGKAMFSEASVCSQGGLDLPPGGGSAYLVAATAAVSTHPTGMPSCY